jgi:hypothetical protein
MVNLSHLFNGMGLPPGLAANAGTGLIVGSPAIPESLNFGFVQLTAKLWKFTGPPAGGAAKNSISSRIFPVSADRWS